LDKTTLTNCEFFTSDPEQTKKKVLNYAKKFSTFCFLDNHQYQLPHHSEECILAAGVKRTVRAQTGKALEQLQEFLNEKSSWLFGHLGYDLKNEIEALRSEHFDGVGFPDLYFFEPELLIRLSGSQLIIEAGDPLKIKEEIDHVEINDKTGNSFPVISQRFSQQEYIDTVNKLKEHIRRGDCYEINFCQEFFTTAKIDPLTVFLRLSKISPNPFSSLYRVDDHWLICASPERYIRKEGDNILSQPIKGTMKRELADVAADEGYKLALSESEKDRSENVMVVDLVRNDLSKVCEESSVGVDELFGIYSFPQVHQMISTVSGKLRKDISFADIIRATFPMGSMTGAPKKKVMELIEQYERTRRGIFSGAVGYISPDGDFDLNVVIRSIMYNAATDYLCFQAGSGITFYSDAESEWEECLLKVSGMFRVLGVEAEVIKGKEG